jgi:hypothetical protein
MVGFWTTIQAVTREVDCPGPGQPFPGYERGPVGSNSSDIYAPIEPSNSSGKMHCEPTNMTWPAEMALVPAAVVEESLRGQPPPRGVAPRHIGAVWEPVTQSSSSSGNISSASVATAMDTTAVLQMDASKRNIQAHYKSCFQGF